MTYFYIKPPEYSLIRTKLIYKTQYLSIVIPHLSSLSSTYILSIKYIKLQIIAKENTHFSSEINADNVIEFSVIHIYF